MKSAKSPDVTIVSKNADTLAQLREYLVGAGLHARTTTTASLDGSSDVMVLFPDDYEFDDVRPVLETRAAATVVIVVVTNDPHRFEPFASTVVVVPKPAWAWMILEAIRIPRGQSQR